MAKSNDGAILNKKHPFKDVFYLEYNDCVRQGLAQQKITHYGDFLLCIY